MLLWKAFLLYPSRRLTEGPLHWIDESHVAGVIVLLLTSRALAAVADHEEDGRHGGARVPGAQRHDAGPHPAGRYDAGPLRIRGAPRRAGRKLNKAPKVQHLETLKVDPFATRHPTVPECAVKFQEKIHRSEVGDLETRPEIVRLRTSKGLSVCGY